MRLDEEIEILAERAEKQNRRDVAGILLVLVDLINRDQVNQLAPVVLKVAVNDVRRFRRQLEAN